MIEIIKEQVKMPSLSTERRFQTICVNNKWEVVDTTEKGFAMAVFMRKVYSKPLLQNQCYMSVYFF